MNETTTQRPGHSPHHCDRSCGDGRHPRTHRSHCDRFRKHGGSRLRYRSCRQSPRPAEASLFSKKQVTHLVILLQLKSSRLYRDVVAVYSSQTQNPCTPTICLVYREVDQSDNHCYLVPSSARPRASINAVQVFLLEEDSYFPPSPFTVTL